MLEIKNVTKIYKTDEVEQKALDNVSVNFRKNEFVAVLGQSGSGKSTLLNIIGGLDHYNDGDLIINGISTKKYLDSDWDTYRNHKIGFIFQNYNLIAHQSVLSNVELALTLSGVSKKERMDRAKEALIKVGLKDHINKNPKQLSGGQMQRVAIARALVNNPDIILADEPTGALDSETSIQIMDLLKEIGKDKLIIMVTHNPELANKYSNRIIELKDGKIISDTNPYDGQNESIEKDTKKRSSMSLLTALSLSKNNLLTKQGRTILTAIAGSVGIIGIALVLFLSNGVNNYINDMNKNSFSTQAISIRNEVYDDSASGEIDPSVYQKKKIEHKGKILANDDISTSTAVTSSNYMKKNDLKSVKSYIEEHKNELEKYSKFISYKYNVDLELYDKDKNNEIIKISPIEGADNIGGGLLDTLLSTSILKNAFLELNADNQYEVISGHAPKDKNDVVLVVNKEMEIPLSVIYSLNIKDKNEVSSIMDKSLKGESIKLDNEVFDYNQIIGKKYKLINAANYYQKIDGVWLDKSSDNKYLTKLYDDSETLEIVGILKVKDDNSTNGFLGYSHDLIESYIKYANKSQIVKEQRENPSINVFTGTIFDNVNTKYDTNLKLLGSAELDDPYEINIYPKEVDSKEKITKFLDDYNKNVKENKKVKYEDDMASLTSALSSVVSVISYVIIAFVSISLIVSAIMIGIITYISVLERTKEIGILRAIGASKKDIKRVFTAETIIEGLFSGCLGIFASYFISKTVNILVEQFGNIKNIMSFSIVHALILIGISVLLTVLSGLAPANMASKKEPVESLKAE